MTIEVNYEFLTQSVQTSFRTKKDILKKDFIV